MNALMRETDAQRKVLSMAKTLSRLHQLDCPLVHRFTPGMYVRQITMPKGALIISRIHKTTHPFVISKGKCVVWDEKNGTQRLKAPHTGITTPSTCRVLYIEEECVWTTFHPGLWPADTDPEKIIAEITDTPSLEGVEELSEMALKQLAEMN